MFFIHLSFVHLVHVEVDRLSPEEVEKLKNDPMVRMASDRGPVRDSRDLDILENGFDMKIVQDLPMHKLQGLLALWETDDGVLESKLLTGENGTTPKMSQVRGGSSRKKIVVVVAITKKEVYSGISFPVLPNTKSNLVRRRRRLRPGQQEVLSSAAAQDDDH